MHIMCHLTRSTPTLLLVASMYHAYLVSWSPRLGCGQHYERGGRYHICAVFLCVFLFKYFCHPSRLILSALCELSKYNLTFVLRRTVLKLLHYLKIELKFNFIPTQLWLGVYIHAKPSPTHTHCKIVLRHISHIMLKPHTTNILQWTMEQSTHGPTNN